MSGLEAITLTAALTPDLLAEAERQEYSKAYKIAQKALKGSQQPLGYAQLRAIYSVFRNKISKVSRATSTAFLQALLDVVTQKIIKIDPSFETITKVHRMITTFFIHQVNANTTYGEISALMRNLRHRVAIHPKFDKKVTQPALKAIQYATRAQRVSNYQRQQLEREGNKLEAQLISLQARKDSLIAANQPTDKLEAKIQQLAQKYNKHFDPNPFHSNRLRVDMKRAALNALHKSEGFEEEVPELASVPDRAKTIAYGPFPIRSEFTLLSKLSHAIKNKALALIQALLEQMKLIFESKTDKNVYDRFLSISNTQITDSKMVARLILTQPAHYQAAIDQSTSFYKKN